MIKNDRKVEQRRLITLLGDLINISFEAPTRSWSECGIPTRYNHGMIYSLAPGVNHPTQCTLRCCHFSTGITIVHHVFWIFPPLSN